MTRAFGIRRVLSALLPCLLVLGAGSAAQSADLEPALGVEAGSPLKLSTNLGVRLASSPDSGSGFLLQAQPGIGGGAVNVGWMPISFAADGSQALGAAIKARLLRTWGSPWGLETGRTYGGFELGLAVGVKVSVGVLWKLGSEPGKRTVVTWGVGVGL